MKLVKAIAHIAIIRTCAEAEYTCKKVRALFKYNVRCIRKCDFHNVHILHLSPHDVAMEMTMLANVASTPRS